MGNCMCTSKSDFEDELDSLPPLTLDQVLAVFLLCFEAAIEALPLLPLDLEATRLVPQELLPELPDGLVVWEYALVSGAAPYLIKDFDVSTLPLPLQEVHQALRKKDLCDHFCLLLLDGPLQAKLQELRLGRARWIKFPPRARTLYTPITHNQENSAAHLEPEWIFPPLHSVFELTTTSGEELIFDGTPEQFGWTDCAWTIDKSEVEAYYVQKEDGKESFGCLDQEEKDYLKALVFMTGSENGFWGVVSSRMQELIAELDWNSFKGLSDMEMKWKVVRQARRKFDGVANL